MSSVAIIVLGSPTFFPQNDWTIWKFRSYVLWLGCVNCYTQTLMNASIPTLAWRIPSVITQKAAMTAFAKLDLKKARLANASVSIPPCSRSCCTVTLWCSMTDRLAGRKWGTLFLVRGARRARHRGVTNALTRCACLALHAREKSNSACSAGWYPASSGIVRLCEAGWGWHCAVSTSFPRSVKRVETWERVGYSD